MNLDARSTALVMIDLQNGVLGRATYPRPGAEVLAAAARLAARFREAGALVIWVRVAWSADFGDALKLPVDEPFAAPAGGFPPGFIDFPPGLVAETDLVVTKRQWGAFYGTDLELQLRRRGVQTIVLGGIATNFGVESTAREAWERGIAVVIAEDAAASLSAEAHQFAVSHILPRIARVTRSDAISFKDE